MPDLKQDAVPVNVNGHILSVSHLNKVYFPEIELTKGEVLKYYTDMAPYILPHIAHSPFVMVRFPEEIHGEFFYQKECPAQAPGWVTRFKDPYSQFDSCLGFNNRLSRSTGMGSF